jgi:hypothetical protein
VGAGKNDRAWCFRQRSKRWFKEFGEEKPTVKIIKDGLSKDEALKLEAKIIEEHEKNGTDLINVFSGVVIKGSGSKVQKVIKKKLKPDDSEYWASRGGLKVFMARLKKAQEEKCPKPRLGAKLSEEHKRKLLEKTHLPEIIEKRRLKMVGRKLTEEHKKKIGRKGIENKLFGVKFSDEHRKKISEALTGRVIGPMSDDHKRKISESRINSEAVKASGKKIREIRKKNGTDKGYFTCKAREVMCIETGEKFRSAKEAAASVFGSDKNIQACCVGRKKRHKGFTWRYTDVSP